jgi:hypothetical protein
MMARLNNQAFFAPGAKRQWGAFSEEDWLMLIRLLKEGGATDDAKAAFAWLTAVGRRPAASETQVTLDALRAHRARYAAQPADATKLITFGESKPDATLPAPEVAAWTLTASLLLNLDETLNR